MKKSKELGIKYPLSVQKQVDQAIITFNKLIFELSLSSRTLSEIESAILRYYLNFPDTTIKPNTLVGCITYLISSRNNEHISMSTIASNVEISISWLSKKKKNIAKDLDL